MEQRLKWCCHKPRKCQNSQETKGAKRILPWGLWRDHGLPTPWLWTSSLQNCWEIIFCCFKSPNLWYFVTATKANKDIYVGYNPYCGTIKNENSTGGSENYHGLGKWRYIHLMNFIQGKTSFLKQVRRIYSLSGKWFGGEDQWVFRILKFFTSFTSA